MEALLETRALSIHFGGLKAVENVDLTVNKGEIMSLIGPNGAGKTTFFNLVSGFLKPTSGTLYIDDNDITQLSLSDYRHFISVVPQNSLLFSGVLKWFRGKRCANRL